MPSFGKSSTQRLATCHPDLQRLFEEVVKIFDCTILTGHRGEVDQNRAFDQGRSKLRWPNGNHNRLPSTAVDVAPYPIPDWTKGVLDFAMFGGYVQGVAANMGIKIRYGGDWNGNKRISDENFKDLVHFELLEP